MMASHEPTLPSYWDSFLRALEPKDETRATTITGKSLSIGAVVAVARYGVSVEVDQDAMRHVAAGEEAVRNSLTKGQVVYGVNTGFGGSADTRTTAIEELQRELVRGLHYGYASSNSDRSRRASKKRKAASFPFDEALPLEDHGAATCMPESWVRAAMLIRLNSLIRGSSGVKVSTIEILTQLIDHEIVPLVPLRGSISASGDLSPLSYIGGLMQGKPTLKAWVNDPKDHSRRLVRADRALSAASITPIRLGAKEGLAIVNGTAMSAAVAALAIHEITMQTNLSQILTAMSVEALKGTDESFDPFFANSRPHPGQIDSSRNIFAFLADSKLVYRNDGTEEASLRQDRYSIRTASQWIGPVMEDLELAQQQVTIELNSVTDNPLIDIDTGRILHGGNFQAKAVTSATEKARLVAQSLGRMLSVQCTELINPMTNRGLPPNLVVDDPSASYIWKGTDILVASLASELGFLAGPMRPHVQTAEMGNQALNSLALISSRYTVTAAGILAQLSAAHLVALCQAFDLRALHTQFLDALRPQFTKSVQDSFTDLLKDNNSSSVNKLDTVLWEAFRRRLDQSAGLDPAARFTAACQSLQPLIITFAAKSTQFLDALESWTSSCAEVARSQFEETRTAYLAAPDATPLLGKASARLYNFVRRKLGVAFLNEDGITTPSGERQDEMEEGEFGEGVPTMGSLIGRVVEATRDGSLYQEVASCFNEIA